MAQQQTVAVLGLGGMGRGMAASLLRAGLSTIVWNRSPGPAERLAERGADVAESAADAARRADVVVTMVTDADAVLSIATGQGMLAAMRQGAIWAQMSTIGVAGTERIADLVARDRPDVTLIDAPVAGTRAPAEQGKLAIFASGDEAARPRISPVFDALGQKTVWLGPVGAGSRMKLANNLLLAFVAEGMAESVALGRSLGLDLDAILSVFKGSTLASPWAVQKMERIGQDEYSPEYPLALALKDVDLAVSQVDPERFRAAASIAEEWRKVADRGMAGDDVTVVTRALLS